MHGYDGAAQAKRPPKHNLVEGKGQHGEVGYDHRSSPAYL